MRVGSFLAYCVAMIALHRSVLPIRRASDSGRLRDVATYSAASVRKRSRQVVSVSLRTGRSRCVACVPISSARYRTGPTSASACLRWASILAFSICRLARAAAWRWRSATISERSRRFWSAIVIAAMGRPSRVHFSMAASIWAMPRRRECSSASSALRSQADRYADDNELLPSPGNGQRPRRRFSMRKRIRQRKMKREQHIRKTCGIWTLTTRRQASGFCTSLSS